VSLLRIKRPPYLFALSWLLVMSLPALLSVHGSVAKRVIGALPAIMALIAMGALVPWDKVRGWSQRKGTVGARAVSITAAVLIVAGMIYSAVSTYRDYFVVWAGDPDMFTHFEVGLTAIGEYASTLPQEEEVYLSPGPAGHPGVIYNSGNRPGLKSFDGNTCLVVPAQTRSITTFMIVPGEDPESLDLLQSVFPQGGIVAEGPLHYQQPHFYAFRVPAGAEAQIAPAQLLDATWGDSVRLLGYDPDLLEAKPGDILHLALTYQALQAMETNYTTFVHLVGPENPGTGEPLWGQADSEPCGRTYPTSQWSPGEIVVDRITISIPAEAVPGEYQIKIGFYDLTTMTRLPAVDATGNPVPDDAVLLGTFRIYP
jgi:hypothetical protein